MSETSVFVRNLRLVRALAQGIPTLIRTRPGRTYTVADAVERVVDRFPSNEAIAFGDRSIRYRELDEAANRVAHWARAQGLRPGDVVALLMENRPEFIFSWLGLAKAGVVAALINTNLTGRPLAHCLAISGARRLILDAALEANWRGALDALDEPLETWTSGGIVDGTRDFDAACAALPSDRPPAETRAGVTSRDKLFYIFTSGTTGLPKAANFSHQRFLLTSAGGAGVTRLAASDRMYIVLPLYHTAGGVLALGSTLSRGATVVLARRFSATHFWEDCVRHRVTTFQYIGELCRYLLNSPPHPDERRHELRLCIGNGLRPEVWSAFQERFAIPWIYEFYGATEGNVTLMNVDNEVGSIGRMPASLRRASGLHLVRFDIEKQDVVRGPDGFCLEAAPDEPGEAIGRISETARFEGYADTDATEKKILRDVFEKGDAYFRTGDLLRIDDQDYFYFVDRIGDTFRWKGENVATGEIAQIVSRCPGVADVNVYGVEVPGAEGRAGMASIVATSEFELATLAERVITELPAYARPLFVRILPAIELTGTFKHRKVDAVREGFDPNRIDDDLYLLHPESHSYVALDKALHGEITRGVIRL